MTDPDRKPLEARCLKCDHRWTFAYTPMELGAFVRVLNGVCCPSCGARPRDLRLVAQPEGVPS